MPTGSQPPAGIAALLAQARGGRPAMPSFVLLTADRLLAYANRRQSDVRRAEEVIHRLFCDIYRGAVLHVLPDEDQAVWQQLLAALDTQIRDQN